MRNNEDVDGFEGEASNTSMMSGACSPYQPTTEPVRSSSVLADIKCDSEYLTSCFGILKILEVIFSLVSFVCIETVMLCLPCGGVYFFEFVSCSAFLFSGALLLFFSLGFHARIPLLNWNLMDLFSVSVSSVFFFLASVVLVSLNHTSANEITAVVFGFLATAVFGLNTALGVRQWRLRDAGTAGAQSSEYTRARTASQGEAQPDLQ